MSTQQIIQGDCLEVMRTFADKSFDLVLTSPPYNVGIDYGEDFDDNKEWEDYRAFLKQICEEMYRVLRIGGRVCWNVPSFSSRQNLYFDSLTAFYSAGFKQYAEIIWDKKQISSRTAWGSFQSASEPNILPSHEYLLVFYKGEKNLGEGENDIAKENFIRWTDGMWSFPPETNSNHPAPFPIELSNRCLQMFSYVEANILDPFCGSGTTLRSAKNLNRNALGIEISPEYCEIARSRLKQEMLF